jgi:cytosine/adenosine deaminase-related metal-dependent hydrolase
MSFDLIVRNATLPDGRSGVDIGVSAGRISAIEPLHGAEAGREIDAAGHLVCPPFVDCHFHMDATLSLGLPRLNQSGTLLEGIALWGELKPILTREAVVERALRYCDLAFAAMSTSATTGSWRSRRSSRSATRSGPGSTCSSSPSPRTAISAHPAPQPI